MSSISLPEDSDDLSIFLLTSVSLTLLLRRDVRIMLLLLLLLLLLLSIELEVKNPFESQLQDLLLQVPFTLNPETFPFSWI